MRAPNLTTDRLHLRELTEDDAGFVRRLLNEPAFLRFIGDRGVRTTAEARDYIRQGPIASYRRHGFGLYLVELKGLPTAIGLCGLIKRDSLEDVDIGYAFLPEFWSKGYALEAAQAVLAHGIEVIGLRRIVAIVSPDNERSEKVLGKLGLRFERMLTWPDDGSELKLYGLDSPAT